VLIGHPDDAVVFDFKPSIEAGAEMLGRRGEDQRFDEDRPAAQRRREIDEAMPERGETESRADVARRIDEQRRAEAKVRKAARPPGPMSYEIGSKDDPDRVAEDD
jgi:GTP-binding protein